MNLEKIKMLIDELCSVKSGQDGPTFEELAAKISVWDQKIRRAIKEMVEEGELLKTKHYHRNGAWYYRYTAARTKRRT